MKSEMKFLLLSFVVVLAVTGSVLAFAVGTPYHKNRPLEMYPGQERTVSFNLQNCPWKGEDCGGKDIEVSVNLVRGSEIAQIIGGERYVLPYGSSDNEFKVKFSIPETNVEPSYAVSIVVKDASVKEEGNVQLTLEYPIDFFVIIKDKSEILGTGFEEPGNSNLILILVIVIIILVITVLVILIRFLNK